MKRLIYFVAFAILIVPILSIGPRQSAKAADVQYGGYIDSFARYTGRDFYSVRGWAYNPENPSSPVVVDVYIDGMRLRSVEMTSKRYDVINFTGADVFNSFNDTIETNAFQCKTYQDGDCHSTHTVQLFSRDLATNKRWPMQNGEESIATDSLGVIGYIDRITKENPQSSQIFVRGWALEPTYPSDLDVYVLADGEFAGYGHVDIARADVENSYNNGTIYHGFAVPIDVAPSSAGDSSVSLQIYVFSKDTYQFTTLEYTNYYFE